MWRLNQDGHEFEANLGDSKFGVSVSYSVRPFLQNKTKSCDIHVGLSLKNLELASFNF